MKTNFTSIFSLAYLLLKTSLGFLIHPYQTMTALIHTRNQPGQRLYFLLVITPLIYFLLAVGIWRLGLRSLVSLVITASCSLMVIKTGTVFFVLWWQLSLLYLWGKLTFFSRKGTHE